MLTPERHIISIGSTGGHWSYGVALHVITESMTEATEYRNVAHTPRFNGDFLWRDTRIDTTESKESAIGRFRVRVL